MRGPLDQSLAALDGTGLAFASCIVVALVAMVALTRSGAAGIGGGIVLRLAGLGAAGGASFQPIQSRGVACQRAGGGVRFRGTGQLSRKPSNRRLVAGAVRTLQSFGLVFHALHDVRERGRRRSTGSMAGGAVTSMVDDGGLVRAAFRMGNTLVLERESPAMGMGGDGCICCGFGGELAWGSANGCHDLSPRRTRYACGR